MTIESAYGGELFKAPDKRERIGQGVLNHVLIIPDNNRTWAQRHGLSVREGYEVGARRMVEAGATAATVPGLDNLTIHVVSLDNILKRHPDELAHIWGAVQGQLFDPSNGLPQLVENGARIRVVGGLDGLDDGIPDYISAGFRELINGSVDKTGLNVSFVIGYDKDQEMEDALASAERAGQNPRRWHVVK